MLSATIRIDSPAASQATLSLDASARPQLSAACALLAVLVQAQTTNQTGARNDVELDFKKLEALKHQLAEAIQQAQEAADDSGFFGFLGDVFGSDIAQIAGAVATIAAVVATGGAAAPLALVALSAALQVSAKVGAELGLDPKICMAIGIASAAVGLCSGAGAAQGTSALGNAARSVALGAKVAQGTAVAAGGGLHFVSAHYQAKQLGFQADAVGIQAQNDSTDLDLDDALELLQRALRTEQRQTETVAEILRNDADTNTALCDRI